MNLRARIAKLENPNNSPCHGLADRLRAALDAPEIDETDEEIEARITRLEATGDRLSIRLARAFRRSIHDKS